MLSYVVTTKRREMQAFFCEDCNALFDPIPYWSIRASLYMHRRGSGHMRIHMLKIDEVDETKVKPVGRAYGRVDLLLQTQGKEQPRDVMIYEERSR